MKKFFAVLLSLVLVLSMGVTALAAGNGTITINNAVTGEDYTIYKMFDFAPISEGSDKGRYTVVSEWEGFLTDNEYLALDSEAGTIKWTGAETDVRKAELAKAAVAYAKDKGISGTKITAAGTTVEFKDLDLGYYAVDTSLGAICALTTTNTNATVEEKNGQPTVEKKINDGGLVDANNAAIGDTVNYQVTITAGKGTVNYVLHDTMSAGLTFDAGSVVVKNGEATLEEGADKDYVLNTSCTDGCTFEIDLTDAYEATLAETDTIVVTYSATLDTDAVIGNKGNPNTITLTYGNKQETTEDTVITYTTELVIDKVDGDGIALEGAGFTLYKDVIADENKVGEELKTGSTFTWTGLEEGKYILVETTVPAGYNKAADIEFTITCTEPGKVDSVDDEATWSSDEAAITVTANGTFEGTVENKTGSLLPETGGIGTTIFYIVGLTLMLGAAILLISKKRMAAKAE